MNKEQFRKELEDAIEYVVKREKLYQGLPATREEYNKVPDPHTYITTRLAALDDGKIKTENMSNLKLADFPVLVEMEKGIKMIPFGTVEYWKQRCINREKMDDPTYSDFERSNCQHFHRLLVNKQK